MAIRYLHRDNELKITREKSLLELCMTHRIAMDHTCEGMASCGTCRYIVVEGLDDLPERHALEQEMAEDRGFSPQERLGCQTKLSQIQHLVFKLPKDD